MGQLAGALLHVGAFDVHPRGAAVFQRHVQVPVERDRLVVLADLVVLRRVRVEVVVLREQLKEYAAAANTLLAGTR